MLDVAAVLGKERELCFWCILHYLLASLGK